MASWLKFHGTESSIEADIRTCLAAAGVGLWAPDKATRYGCGILCFSQFDDGLLTLLGDLRRDGADHVVALATTASAMKPGSAWRLLHAGASEAMVWDGGADVPRQIQSRLERWAEL